MPYPVTPKTWVAGDVLTAAQMNAELRDALLAAFPLSVNAWTAFTATFTSVTVGNGTQVSSYQRVGRLIFYRIKFTFGSTSAMGTDPTFTLPVTAAAAYVAAADQIGHGQVRDASSGVVYPMWARVASVTAGLMVILNAATTYVTQDSLTATVPFTWAVADSFTVTGVYEAAT